MEIQSTQSVATNSTQKTSSVSSTAYSDSSFASELSTAKDNAEKTNNADENKSDKNTEVKEQKKTEEKVDNAIDELKDTVGEVSTKQKSKDTNTQHKDSNMIDNKMNFQEFSGDLNFNMNSGMNMNFSNDGQSFSAFVKQGQTKFNTDKKDSTNDGELLSSLEENMAMANKTMLMMNDNSTITVQNEKGIKKVDADTHLTLETILSYDSVIMDKADVEFFVNLVEKGSVDITEVQNTQKSSQVSKTLADLLAKAMNENKPVRIDFDNDISVIIKINRQGKISADFLPSSHVAEAYLKENLPLLKQRFDEKNIDYEELNQRKQKQDTQDNSKKKGRKDE